MPPIITNFQLSYRDMQVITDNAEALFTSKHYNRGTLTAEKESPS